MSADFAWTPYRHQPKRVDGKCKRGHVVADSNARPTDKGSARCRTCTNGIAYAKRHNLFMDDQRVIDHMTAYYESHRDD